MPEQKTHNPYLMPGAVVIAGLIIAGAIFYTQGFSSPAPSQPGDGQAQGPVEVSIDLDGWPSIGDPNASVTMVEYSDFACPFCARFWGETLPSVKSEYVDVGLVRFVYKDFAVVGGERAAEASHCAAEQGAYWEYHNILFGNNAQDRGRWADASVHRGYAEQLGLDADALVACFESRRYQEKVAESTQEALANGGQGTPYFLINEEPVSGAQPFSVFKTVIDLALEE